MPRPSLTPAMLRAMRSRTTAEEVVILLTLNHSGWATPIRRAYRRINFVSRGETYFLLHFAPSLPGQSPEGIRQWQITLDGVDQTILSQLRAVSMPKPSCLIEIVLASDPDTVQMTSGAGYEVVDYDWDESTITLEISLPSLLKEGYPGGRIGPNNFAVGF